MSIRSLLVLCLSLGVTACLTVAKPPLLLPVAAQPEGFPDAIYATALAAGDQVYRLAENSQVTMLVYRDGRAAKLGHNHVVTVRKLGGYVHLADDIADSRIDLFVHPGELIVDEPRDRAAAGDEFSTVPTPRAVAGTRANMLGDKVLDAASHPFVTVTGTVEETTPSALVARIEITIRGVTKTLTTPVAWTQTRDRLEVGGELTVLQTDFGITPFSVLGGALVVRDAVAVRFDLVADRLAPRT